ncbi:MAG: DUF3047 domain-containing protein [Bermanella sp.]
MNMVSKRLIKVLVGSCLLLTCGAMSLAQPLLVAEFSKGQLAGWQEKSFAGATTYKIMLAPQEGRAEGELTVLSAHSDNSASGLGKEISIDLMQTPYINWSWRIENNLKNLGETSKDGDDYAARLYVVKDGGWRIWQTRALNYVWSSNQRAGSRWDNAFVGANAKMLAVRGVEHPVQQWFQEKRNVYEDLIALFGDKGSAEANQQAYRYLDAVALMTDTDNSAGMATAFYGDIYFSEH